MLLSTFAGCASENEETEEDLGAYVYMYLTEPVYNFDPALAFGNEAALRVVSLMYDNLFILDENGKPEKSLVKKCDIDKDEYTITLTLREDTYWSDGSPVSANDVFFTWERLLDATKSFEAASLLYDVENARAAKEGNASIEDVGIELFDESSFMIKLNEGTDIDDFLVKLSSYALVPLRSDVVRRTEKEIDWAKSPTSLVTSGPFRLRTISYKPEDAGIILERNAYYRRDFMNDKPDKAVTPFRLIIDYTMSGEEILAAYEEGKIFYVGDLPLDVRSKHTLEEWAEIGEVNDALSTHSYVVNNNAVVRYYNANEFKNLSAYTEGLVAGQDGDQIFANPAVRQALSLAIDREEIAKTIVFAEAADGLIPGGVYESSSKKDMFADNRQNGIATTKNMDAAKAALSSAGIDASKYMFAISVPAYDEVHMKIAEMVQAAWTELGFHVAISAINTVDNKDKAVSTGAVITGIKDDIFAENYAAGKYEIAAIDYTAFSPSPFSLLAPIAKGYSGNASIEYQGTEFTVATHISGYNSTTYNELIESAFQNKDVEARAATLHEAEGVLLKDLPIIPIVFNKSITMESKELSKVDYSYYHCPIFTKTKLKNYEDYIPAEDAE
jgi:oligopeptide transport system substrate-binding protein